MKTSISGCRTQSGKMVSLAVNTEKAPMNAFPRAAIGKVSASRLVIGTNWFVGFSHCTAAKDAYLREHVAGRKEIADILEVFFREGVDTIIGKMTMPPLAEAVREAEDRTGVGAVMITTPAFPVTAATPAEGIDPGEAAAIIDAEAEAGARVCMPHQSTTDALCDRCTHTIRHAGPLMALIRERGMEPGLSTHMPEAIVYADESGLDVETYIAIYNSMGFLMPIEVDWTARLIQNARKPVLTIKPMAAGQVRPFQGLAFVWNTIREQDMVAAGVMSPREAAEVVELSRQFLERRPATFQLQETRSKKSVKA